MRKPQITHLKAARRALCPSDSIISRPALALRLAGLTLALGRRPKVSCSPGHTVGTAR